MTSYFLLFRIRTPGSLTEMANCLYLLAARLSETSVTTYLTTRCHGTLRLTNV